MGKHKKKHSKKAKDKVKEVVPEDILDAAAVSIRKFRKITDEIAKLSTGQKLAGALVLAAAGLIYLDQRRGKSHDDSPRFDWPRLSKEAGETSATEEAPSAPNNEPPKAEAPSGSGKSRKSAKTSKPSGLEAKKPTSLTNGL